MPKSSAQWRMEYQGKSEKDLMIEHLLLMQEIMNALYGLNQKIEEGMVKGAQAIKEKDK